MSLGSIAKRPKTPTPPEIDPVTGEPKVDAGTGDTTAYFGGNPNFNERGPNPTSAPLAGGEGNDTVDPNVKTDYLNDIVPNPYGAGTRLTPAQIEQMSIEVANQTGAGQSSAENLADWNRKYAENNWTPEQLRSEMVKKALEPDTSQQGSNSGFSFNPSSYAGFLGNSLVPTDVASSMALQQAIENILGGKGGLDINRILGVGQGGSAGASTAAAPAATETSSPLPSYGAAAGAVGGSNTSTNPLPIPTPNLPNPGVPDAGASSKARDASIAASLLGQQAGRPDFTAADQGATTIPDRVGDAMTSFFGLSPIMKAGNFISDKGNHPGDIIFGTPPGAPQGPTDPNLKPMTPEERQRNAQIAAELLANNEANGGI